MDFQQKEIPYYLGLMGGLIVATVVMKSLGVQNNLALLIGGLLIGVGCGYLAEQAFAKKNPPGDQDDRNP